MKPILGIDGAESFYISLSFMALPFKSADSFTFQDQKLRQDQNMSVTVLNTKTI